MDEWNKFGLVNKTKSTNKFQVFHDAIALDERLNWEGNCYEFEPSLRYKVSSHLKYI